MGRIRNQPVRAAGWLLLISTALVPLAGIGSERKDEVGRWNVHAYYGQWSDNRLGQIVQGETEWEDSTIRAIGIGNTWYRANRHILLEAEANLIRHSGLQDHHEVNAAVSLRWMTFPWDRYVDTSFALGVGPSFAETQPPIEEEEDRPATRFLVNLLTEFAFAPPGQDTRSWEIFVRVHHRSGFYDLVSEAKGSNFPSAGIRYYF